MTHTNTEAVSDERLAETCKRLQEILDYFDEEANEALANESERGDLWSDIEIPVADLRTLLALSRRAANSAGGVEVKVGDTVRVLRARNLYDEEVPGKPFAVGETFVVGKVDEDEHMYPCPIVFPEGEVFDFWRADDLEVVPAHRSSPVSAEVTEIVGQVKALEAACNQARLALAGMVSIQSALDALDCRPLGVSAALAALNGGRENG